MVKRQATSPHDPLGITDSACKNQSVVVSVQYGPFNPYIPIRSTTIDSIGYPRMSASGESSTTMHRLLNASGSHPIPTPYDPKTNQYNQDLGLIHSTNGNHLESPNEGSSIDHQAVDRQSGPRPDSRHLCQPALEGLMNSARTETPRQADRNKSDQRTRRQGGGTWAAARPSEGARGEGRPSGLWRLGIQLAVGPQPLRLRNHNFGLAHRIMVKRLATSPHDPLGITDSACKNQLVVVSVQYGPFNTYIPIRSTIIGKSRVARDPIAMHTSWRLNSDIASVTSIGYPRMRASGESSTTKRRILHASGSHPIPPPNDPKRNAVVSTSSNDIVLLSLNFKYHLLDLTNPNDIVRVTSASLLPAGSPVATHYSQSPRRWFQIAAFQLNETTSLHFFDCFPKPAAGHSKLAHLLIHETAEFHSRAINC
ncbi:hypothetical protein F511_02160 [Dorcoceras hygrometricum]|uniref:Uncharacterized protein n=1 Tax=Dorcoceras hygrometricum TaxID=472368 RepID=A0A2Z7B2R8_9LAMI|nr:hypothetical protein F511_02160 [Dorcoceras hygrometricum]